MYPKIIDYFEGKNLVSIVEYHKLNLLEEYFGVIRSREFDMGNPDYPE
jgi:hypothetical protein